MKLHIHELRAGTGTPVVLLHGWLGSGADFEELAASSHFLGRRMLAVDLPGHGASPDYDREYDFAEVASWVAEAVGPDPVDLVGYSLGGRVALYVAGMHRGLVRRLALIGANPGIDHPVEQRKRLELDAERATRLMADPGAFLAEWGELALFGPRTSTAWRGVEARRAASLATHAYGWARALLCLSVGRQLSLWNVPYGVSLPSLYLVGIKDEQYVAVAREFAAQNAEFAKVALIGGAHHAAHLDRPDETARRLVDFLGAARD